MRGKGEREEVNRGESGRVHARTWLIATCKSNDW